MVSSTISWTLGADPEYGFVEITDLRLQIVRANVSAFDRPLNITNCEAPSCMTFPVNCVKTNLRVFVMPVDADAKPEVRHAVRLENVSCRICS